MYYDFYVHWGNFHGFWEINVYSYIYVPKRINHLTYFQINLKATLDKFQVVTLIVHIAPLATVIL